MTILPFCKAKTRRSCARDWKRRRAREHHWSVGETQGSSGSDRHLHFRPQSPRLLLFDCFVLSCVFRGFFPLVLPAPSLPSFLILSSLLSVLKSQYFFRSSPLVKRPRFTKCLLPLFEINRSIYTERETRLSVQKSFQWEEKAAHFRTRPRVERKTTGILGNNPLWRQKIPFCAVRGISRQNQC